MTDRAKLLGLGMICGTVIATATLTTTAGPGQAIQAAEAVAVAATANTTPTIDPALMQEPWEWMRSEGLSVSSGRVPLVNGPVYLEAVIWEGIGVGTYAVLQDSSGSPIARGQAGTNAVRFATRMDLGIVVDGLSVQVGGGSGVAPPLVVLYRCLDGSACNADVTTTGATLPGQQGYARPDGNIDIDDLGYFLNIWTAAS